MNDPFRLMLVTNRLQTHLPLREVIASAVAGGVDAIQVREKDLDAAELLAFVESVRMWSGNARVVVNGSIETARAAGVGLHLPESGPSAADARNALGPGALIGRSVHSASEASLSDGADYLIAGHIFATVSKPDLAPIGLAGLEAIVAATPIPVIAIGGITRDNARHIMAVGAQGAAIMSAINQSPNPGPEAAAIRSELDEPTVEGVAIVLNGRETVVAPNQPIHDFLTARGLKDRLVVIEINGKIAPKSAYSSRVLEAGDSVEIVHFVGGG